jgi:prepilin-type N-terminal cleavage/methylation domain-containing protein
MKKVNNKQGGFTLLELLVVVGILAIIGGALISSLGGQETKAARGAATSSIAGVENAIRIFVSSTGNLPNDMESLVCLPFANAASPGSVANIVDTPLALGSAAVADTAYKFGGVSNVSGVGGGIGKKLADKFNLVAVPADGITALNDAGVTTVRYAAANACDNETGAGTTAVTFAAGEIIAADSALQDITIPNHAFEDPRTGGGTSGRNRGRGFQGIINANSPLMLWGGGDDGYNNLKVGGSRESVLVGLGIGQASDLVGTELDSAFSKAPFYGDVGKDKYAHYIALVQIGLDNNADGDDNPTTTLTVADATWADVDFGNAKVVAVIDARGDFLDEEIAEFSGQKI